MFPPPRPWTPCAKIDPQREYLAFTSCFFLKSPLRAPAFLASANRIMKLANAAPGIIGWSLGVNILKLEFFTLSAWEDAESLHRFTRDEGHKSALQEFRHDLRRKSVLVYYKVWGRDLPLTWKDAIERQRQSAAAP
jgi:heme-degrading monooxygenase HmoA